MVGARVAGSVLATLLGKYGHRVLLLDRSTFPSDTISTHFFRAPALRAFAAIDVLDEVLAAAPPLTVNYNVVDGVEFPEAVDRPDDFPFYLCVRRITLDDILARRAASAPNVELRQGTRATGLIRDGDRVVGVQFKHTAGDEQATARVTVGADGVRSLVAGSVDLEVEHEEPVNRTMYYAYYRGVPPNDGPAAEFHYRGNHLVYCFPCDADLTLLAASLPVDRFQEFKRQPEQMLGRELEAMSGLAPRLAAAVREGPVRGTGSIPGYLRVPYGNGWALVGDAGMVMDPWSGQGIDQAATHAVMLAQRLSDYLEGRADWPTAMQSYHAERNDFSLKTYRRTCQFSRDLRPMTRAALAKRGLA